MQINMGGLRAITIKPGAKTAIFQGGTYDGQVIDYLWDKGYVASKLMPYFRRHFINPII